MRAILPLLFAAIALTLPAQTTPSTPAQSTKPKHPPTGPVDPTWTTQIPPFRIADNLFYVGSQDLAAYLITTPAGNILINSNLPSSPAQIHASIEQLGFRYADTKILLLSQAHFDHAGGTAQVLRQTHAKAMVMQGDDTVVASGGRTDFLFASGSLRPFPPAPVARVLHDGDTVTLGPVTLTAHRTAGHTLGCTTYTFQAHLPGEPASTLRNVVIVGGYSFWSDFHFTDTRVYAPAAKGKAPKVLSGHAPSYPGIAEDFRHTFQVYRSLPVDIFLADHGQHFGLKEKLTRYPTEGPKVFLDPEGYKTTIAAAQQTFEKALTNHQ